MSTDTINQYSVADLDAAIGRMGDSLGALAGGHLLLTGGTGFFGQWLLAALVRANAARGLGLAITVLTRSAEAFRRRSPDLATGAGVALLEGDVRTFRPPSARLTHVVHAATDTSQEADSRPLELMDIIVSGTRHVLDVAASTGAGDVLYVSSGAVYGAQGPIDRVPENHMGACDPLDRRSTYGESKRMAEQICAIHVAGHGLRVRIARGFAFAGPSLPLDRHFAIGNFIGDALAGRTIHISGDGTATRSYLYAGDLAAWLVRILVAGTSGRAYNVGSDRAVSMRELAGIVDGVIAGRRSVHVALAPQPGAHRSRYVPSIDRARDELGLEAWTSLEDAIAKSADWARRTL